MTRRILAAVALVAFLVTPATALGTTKKPKYKAGQSCVLKKEKLYRKAGLTCYETHLVKIKH